MPEPQRRLAVEGLVNARDLGGLPLVDGGITPAGVFYRSEVVERITPRGWDQLHAAGIRCIVDLRAPGERKRDVNARPEWLTTVSVDLDGPENRDFWPYYENTGLDGTPIVFLPHLAAMPERMGSVLTALAQAPAGGVLFHCMSGRDRTGLTAMVLLSMVGVQPVAIVDDYLETARLGGDFALTANSDHESILIEDLLSEYGTTMERAFLDALEGFHAHEFLEQVGLTQKAREALETWRGHLPPRSSVTDVV